MTLLQNILRFTSTLSALPAIIIGRGTGHLLWYYAIASFVFDINGWVLKHFELERHWASNLFLLIEFLLITLYFINTIFTRQRNIGYGVMIVIAMGFTVHTYTQSIWMRNYAGGAMLYGIYIFYCLCGFYKVIQEIEYIHIERNPLFIFCTAFMLYASGILIILLVENNFFESHRELIIDIWQMIHNPLNILKNLLLAYGLQLVRQKR